MVNIEKLDDELYKSAYGLPRVGDYNEIWSRIKSNPLVLKEAVQIKKDKFNEKDIVRGLAISEAILIDYESADKVVYTSLINSIYTNTDIARTVIRGASNGGYSFLLMSLWNHNLELTEEQKAFAVDEAMNKIGTTRYRKKQEDFSKKLDEKGLSDDNTTFVDIDGSINPIGQKTRAEYAYYMLASLDNKQAHGMGEFDIRYHILRNPNWTLEEKQKLIMDFWYDDESYDEHLEQWEWGIVNDLANYNNEILLEKDELYNYSYDMLLSFYNSSDIANKIWQEIQFCRQMRKLRPGQPELKKSQKKKTLIAAKAK